MELDEEIFGILLLQTKILKRCVYRCLPMSHHGFVHSRVFEVLLEASI